MELNFLEYEKRKVWDKVDDKEVEVEVALPVPFETHPHELVSSVTKRYVKAQAALKGGLAPPPGMKFFLRTATTSLRINPDSTVLQLQKEGIILVQLGTSF